MYHTLWDFALFIIWYRITGDSVIRSADKWSPEHWSGGLNFPFFQKYNDFLSVEIFTFQIESKVCIRLISWQRESGTLDSRLCKTSTGLYLSGSYATHSFDRFIFFKVGFVIQKLKKKNQSDFLHNANFRSRFPRLILNNKLKFIIWDDFFTYCIVVPISVRVGMIYIAFE